MRLHLWCDDDSLGELQRIEPHQNQKMSKLPMLRSLRLIVIDLSRSFPGTKISEAEALSSPYFLTVALPLTQEWARRGRWLENSNWSFVVRNLARMLAKLDFAWSRLPKFLDDVISRATLLRPQAPRDLEMI